MVKKNNKKLIIISYSGSGMWDADFHENDEMDDKIYFHQEDDELINDIVDFGFPYKLALKMTNTSIYKDIEKYCVCFDINFEDKNHGYILVNYRNKNTL